MLVYYQERVTTREPVQNKATQASYRPGQKNLQVLFHISEEALFGIRQSGACSIASTGG